MMRLPLRGHQRRAGRGAGGGGGAAAATVSVEVSTHARRRRERSGRPTPCGRKLAGVNDDEHLDEVVVDVAASRLDDKDILLAHVLLNFHTRLVVGELAQLDLAAHDRARARVSSPARDDQQSCQSGMTRGAARRVPAHLAELDTEARYHELCERRVGAACQHDQRPHGVVRSRALVRSNKNSAHLCYSELSCRVSGFSRGCALFLRSRARALAAAFRALARALAAAFRALARALAAAFRALARCVGVGFGSVRARPFLGAVSKTWPRPRQFG